MKYVLTMSVEIDTETFPFDLTEEQVVENIKYQLACFNHIDDDGQMATIQNGKWSLSRAEDRSNKNLLRPRVEGRFANHLSNKKISLKELFPEETKETLKP